MAEPKIEPVEETPHVASGEGLEPHASNPESVRQTAERAMKEAMEKAAPADDEQADDTAEGDDNTIDWEAIKGAKTQDADTDQEEGDAAEGDDPDIGGLEPLSVWNAQQQETFRQLEKDAQQYLLDATAAATAPIQQQLDALAPWQRITQQWQPYFEKTLNGVPVENAMESLLNADMILRTGTQQQKVDLLRKLAHDYGVTAEQSQQPQLIPNDLADDPVAQAMAGPLQTVVNELNSLKQQINTQSESFTQAQRQQGQAQVDAFAAATDEKGNLKHPYFKEVETLMEDLAEIANRRGQQPTLEQLYDQACAATPEVRAKVQSAQKAADIIERKKAADARKQAASSVSGSPSGARSVDVQINPNESAEDTVRNAMIAHGLLGG